MAESSGPRPSPARFNDRLGLALAGGSAVGLGLSIALSRLAYDGGANGLTVATARALLFLPVLYGFCRLTGRQMTLAPADRLHALGLGVLMAITFYGNVGAVEYIPIGLAAILFFTFPPMIGVIQAVVTREAPGWMRMSALALAFAGLALMLGISFEKSDPRGIGLSLAAALGAAWSSVWLVRKASHVDGVVMLWHMGVAASIVLAALILASGSVQPPSQAMGWVGLVTVALLQSACLPLYYMAILRIGPLKAGMVANVQPVTSIVAAQFLFGEMLTALELLGGAVVLLGVGLMQFQDSRALAGGRR